ncbi:MAG: MBG domain-containing protein [bacterium]
MKAERRDRGTSRSGLALSALLLFLAWPSLAATAAMLVQDGDTLTFRARNSAQSGGAMEQFFAYSVVTVLRGQNFLDETDTSLTATLATSPGIPVGNTRKLVYKVHDTRVRTNGVLPEWKVQVDFYLDKVPVSSLPWGLPPALPWFPVTGTMPWQQSVVLTLPQDVDNTDPTYIQVGPAGDYLQYAGSQPGNQTPTRVFYQFSPGGSPGQGDELQLTYSVGYASYVTLQIYDSSGRLVRTVISSQLRNPGMVADIWDGHDSLGNPAGDGLYTYVITGVNAVNGYQTWTQSGEILADNTPPLADIRFIKANTPEFSDYSVMGTAHDAQLNYYTLSITGALSEAIVLTNTTSIREGLLGVVDSASLSNGEYGVDLVAWDCAGNSSRTSFPLTVRSATNVVRVHVEEVSQEVLAGSEGYVPTSDEPNTWLEDGLPAGATAMDVWEWSTAIPYSGSRSHTDPMRAGAHGHHFAHADSTLSLSANDNVIQYVYLDPANPPSQILLQFYTANGDGEHRAYWGEKRIPTGGQNGSASLYNMGALPEKGKWVRLKIPAQLVGLAGAQVKGMAFVTYDGKAYWDKTTRSSGYNETQKGSWIPASHMVGEDWTETDIRYTVSRDAHIALTIRDASNRVVRTLVDGVEQAGMHQVLWDGKDDDGVQVPNGKHYFQFSSTNGPIDSNAYGPIPGDWSGESVTPKTTVTDSLGNRYEIGVAGQVVNKHDPTDNLLYAITAAGIGLTNLDAVALDLDANDNLFIAERAQNKVFKLNPQGYYLNELPYPADVSWADKSLGFADLRGLLSDTNGDLLVSDQGGANVRKLVAGRGVVAAIADITAEIHVPYENSLLYAWIPIIGTASARNFEKYTVDYGYGADPASWTTLATSYSQVFDDYRPIPGSATIYGNLATWGITPQPYDTTGGLPQGTYTIRLRVYDQAGNVKEDKVRVVVARLIGSWWAGSFSRLLSDDGLVAFDLPYGAIADNVELFSISAANPSAAPAVDDPDLTLVGKIYEIRPADYQFLKPCTLTMYYTPEQLAAAGVSDESTLKIYRWNPIIQRWIFVYADLNTDANSLTTTLTKFNDGVVYYAVISDPPPAPVIFQPASPTFLRNITVFGKASPSVRVELFVNGAAQGSAQADENTGHFVKSGVQLGLGTNVLTALAVDPVGNTSPTSTSVIVDVVMAQPTAVASVDFKTSDFSVDLAGDVAIGDSLYIELIGTDADSNNVDSTMVTLSSSVTDPTGIAVQLFETAPSSGVYRGTASVGTSSDGSVGSIGVSEIVIETVTVRSDVDPARQDAVNTADTIAPPAPTIASPTHPSLCQDTFETDLDQWANMSQIFGATVTRSADTASSGLCAAKLVKTLEGGDFGAYVRSDPFDARQYPLVGFDYKIPADLKLNLIAYVNGMWKEIVFTDDPKTVETFDEDIYRTVGRIDNVVADDMWRHAEFNLYNMLKNDDPGQTNYIVEELFLADYNLPGWMELVMGNENPQGTTYYVDNLIISEAGRSNSSPTFVWSPHDLSVIGYSHILDQNPGTVPDEISEGSSSSASYSGVADGAWYFHVRSVDAGGNWGPANHYRIVVDAGGPTADSPEPADGSSSGSLQVSLHLSDGTGSGVDPDTIVLELNGTTYGMSSGGLSYDEKSGILTFSLWKVFPVPQPWLNGETIHATLVAAADFAGNPLQSPFSWSWTVDYSTLSGGYLSILTTKGGVTPTWSPDGQRVAFMSERSGHEDIWVMDADDYAELRDTARQVTTNAAGDHHPAWSPVDDRIAFVSERDGRSHVYTIDPGGSNLLQLTAGEYDDAHPTWSPDGLQIAFSRDGEIWTVGPDGSGLAPVTQNTIEYCLEPEWSPAGTNIAFTKSLYIEQVAVVGTDGRGMRALTDSGTDFLPTWAVETNQLLFVTTRNDSPSAIWSMENDGTRAGVHIDNEGLWWDSEPAESPMGGALAFQSTRNGAWNIWVKSQLQIADVGVSPSPFSPNGDGIQDTAAIAFTVVGGAPRVGVRIDDASSNLVATLLDDAFAAEGSNVVTWTGYNDAGARVADGTYTFRIDATGSAGAAAIEKSGAIVVDVTPPSFTEWVIPVISNGPQHIAVTVLDATGVHADATRLQYGVATSAGLAQPDLVGWSDFAQGSEGVLNLSWPNYSRRYLYIRAYAEDDLGNAAYSAVQIRGVGIVLAEVALNGLNQTYNGTPRVVTATTLPTGLPVVIRYDGSTSPPVAAGTYVVTGTVDDPGFEGGATGTLMVARADQTIAFTMPETEFITDTVLLSATASSGLPVTFAVTSGPGTILDGNRLVFTGIGDVVVRASQAGNANWNPAPDVRDLIVVTKAPAEVALNDLNQTYDGTPRVVAATTVPPELNVVITYDGSATPPVGAGSYAVMGTVDDARFEGRAIGILVVAQADQTIAFVMPETAFITNMVVLGATASSGLPVAFAVTSGPGTILDGNHLVFTGTGDVVVTASQAGDANWNPAPDVTDLIAVTKAVAEVTLNDLNQMYDGAPRVVTATTVPPDLNMVITYDGSATPPVTAGTYAVMGTVDDPRFEGRAVGTLVVAQADQTIAFTLSETALITNTVVLSATADSGLPVAFAVTAGPGTILDGADLTFTGTGDVVVTASQVGDANWNPALDVTNTIAVTKVMAEVTLNDLNQTYDGAPRVVTATTVPTNLNVVITYDGSTNPPVGAGAYAVTGTVDDPIFQGCAIETLVVARADQTLAFTMPETMFITNTVALSATASSDLPVTFTVTSGPGTILDGTNLVFRDVGDVVVMASQVGNADWNPAPDVTNTIAVNAVVNLALASRGSTITGNNGANWGALIDGITTGYSGTNGFGYTYWRSAPRTPGKMTLDMKGLCTISSMKLLLWDLDNRFSRYKIEASSNNTTWATIVDRMAATNQCRSWQEIDFSRPIRARYLRLTGTYGSSNHTFQVVEWEVYGVAPPPVILTSAEAVAVPKGGTATFQVRLDVAPVRSTTVTVSRISGDTDITVQTGSSLVFNPCTWSNSQTVTLASAADPDGVSGSAVIRCGAPWLANKDVTATEHDNLALASRGSTITGNNGANWGALIDGITTGYSDTNGFGYTYWRCAPHNPGKMTLDMKALCTISSMKLLLWDLDNRFSRYKIEASSNSKQWTTIVDRTAATNQCRSWQDIRFSPAIRARYLRLTGTYNSSNQTFQVVEWEVYGAAGARPCTEAGVGAEAEPGTAKPGTEAGSSFSASSLKGHVSALEPIDVRTSDPGTNGWNVVDGNPETYWQGQAEAGGWWIVLAYANDVQARAIQVQWAEGSTTNLLLLGSTDADQWYELAPLLKQGSVSFGYLWLVLPEGEPGAVPKVSEIWVDPEE